MNHSSDSLKTFSSLDSNTTSLTNDLQGHKCGFSISQLCFLFCFWGLLFELRKPELMRKQVFYEVYDFVCWLRLYLKSKKSKAVMVSKTVNCSTSSLKIMVILWILLTTFSMFLSSRTCGQSPHFFIFNFIIKIIHLNKVIMIEAKPTLHFKVTLILISIHFVSLTHMVFNEQVPNWIKLPQYLLKPQLIC